MTVFDLISALRDYGNKHNPDYSHEVILSYMDKEGKLHTSEPTIDTDDIPITLHLIEKE